MGWFDGYLKNKEEAPTVDESGIPTEEDLALAQSALDEQNTPQPGDADLSQINQEVNQNVTTYPNDKDLAAVPANDGLSDPELDKIMNQPTEAPTEAPSVDKQQVPTQQPLINDNAMDYRRAGMMSAAAQQILAGGIKAGGGDYKEDYKMSDLYNKMGDNANKESDINRKALETQSISAKRFNELKNKTEESDPKSESNIRARKNFEISDPAKAAEQKAAGAFDNLTRSEINVISKRAAIYDKMNLTEDIANKNREAAGERAKMFAGISKDKSDVSREDKADKGFQDFSNKILNPSPRSAIGRYKINMDSSDAAIALLSGYSKKPVAQMTEQERIKAFNNVTAQQRSELAAALDRLITSSASTIGGREHLDPESAIGKLNQYQQYLTNTPTGTGQGEFINKMYDTINRERNLNHGKLKTTVETLARAHEGYRKKNPEMFDSVINDAITPMGAEPKHILSKEDKIAIEWAKKPENKDNPNAIKILKLHPGE